MRTSSGWLAVVGPYCENAGLPKVVALVTLVATGLSWLLALLISGWLLPEHRFPATLIAILVPLLIAPGEAYMLFHRIMARHEARRDQELMPDNIVDLNQTFDRRRKSDAAAGGKQAEVCVMLLGVDQFETLRAAHGQEFSEEVLRTVGASCLRQLRSHDLFARHGNEEFVALLQATDPDIAVKVVERLRRAIEALQIPLADGTSITITASVGLAQLDYNCRSLEQVLELAEGALRDAKRAGRNRTQLAVSLTDATASKSSADRITPRMARA